MAIFSNVHQPKVNHLIVLDTGRRVDELQVDGSVTDALCCVVTDPEGDGSQCIEAPSGAEVVPGGRKRRILAAVPPMADS